MGVRLFNRSYRLVIDQLAITDLDVSFNVQRSLKKEPNTASISVYNLSSEQRRQIENFKVLVNLSAGYNGENSLIFSGDMRDGLTTREGPDLITTISSGDGEKKKRRAKVSKAFAPGTSIDAVVKACAQALGVGLGNLATLGRVEFPRGGGVFSNGTVLDGFAAEELDRILKSCALEYSIQNNALQILPRRQALLGEAVLLTEDTGLIGTPAVDSLGILHCTSLMVPDIFPGRRIKVDRSIAGEGATGFFRVNKCVYSGDTKGDDWSIEIEAEPLIPVQT